MQRGRYGLLLLAALVSLAVQGVASPGAVQQIVVTTLVSLTLLLALRAADVDHRLARAAAVLGAACIAVAVIRATAGGIGEGPARLMNALLCAFGPPAIALGVIRDLRHRGHVGVESVMGVLTLYILIGMLFGFLYGAIDRFDDDTFFASGVEATTSLCLYFSFTTLTTVGYGDLVAQSDLGHTLSVFEALVGQIYLVTVVSAIVSNLGRPARTRRVAGDR